VTVGDDLRLVLRGRTLESEDQRVLAAFATQAAVAYQHRQLSQAAAAAIPLAETDRIRTALLNAVSHDLHAPIASAKAAVSSLLSRDVDWTPTDRHDLLIDANAALDQLTGLVGNLLDLSRLQAGALSIQAVPVGIDDIISRVLEQKDQSDQVRLDVPAVLPQVLADPGLLERAIANLLENALRYTSPDRPVRISASAHGDIVEVRVIDFGPGIPVKDRDAAFEPFHRRDGQPAGVGLAVARGFIEAMAGVLELEDTPGGGLTSVISLLCAPTIASRRRETRSGHLAQRTDSDAGGPPGSVP
jgi:two-component system sensor histidine kinase KdpD